MNLRAFFVGVSRPLVVLLLSLLLMSCAAMPRPVTMLAPLRVLCRKPYSNLLLGGFGGYVGVVGFVRFMEEVRLRDSRNGTPCRTMAGRLIWRAVGGTPQVRAAKAQ